MIEWIEKTIEDWQDYAVKGQQLAIADTLLDLFWQQHYRGLKGTEFNKAGIEISVRLQLQYLPDDIKALDVEWETPITRESDREGGRVYTLGDLEKFAQQRAEELGRYRPVSYEQEPDGTLTRVIKDVTGKTYRQDQHGK